MEEQIIENCRTLLKAYKSGELGQTKMPEDTNPGFSSEENEFRIAYFTLPMALNYQRDSYKLWEAALKTYDNSNTKKVFDVKYAANIEKEELQSLLIRYKLALQQNKHTATWQAIAKTVNENFGSFKSLIKASDNDFIKLREIVQTKYKKGFPYLSGPKIFNYWSFILSTYGNVNLKNRKYIEIAPDTHITQCSIVLGVITESESKRLTKDQISEKWRTALNGSGIDPIDMHPPLWFWSRNGFLFKL